MRTLGPARIHEEDSSVPSSTYPLAASSEVATGLFSLGGVVIGGLLTAVLTGIRDRSRAREEERKARRLAAADLERATEALRDVRSNMEERRGWPVGGDDDHDEDRTWPPGWERAGWSVSWEGYRGPLASGLGELSFATLARAFGSLVQFENSLAAGTRAFVDTDPEFVARVEEPVAAARRVLPVPGEDARS
jgi:hypothetical protein